MAGSHYNFLLSHYLKTAINERCIWINEWSIWINEWRSFRKIKDSLRFTNGFFPKCSYAFAVTSLPLGVRCINPSCIKKGSYTSSSVPASSPTAVAIVVMPTGPL
jgi:hypothetical protein